MRKYAALLISLAMASLLLLALHGLPRSIERLAYDTASAGHIIKNGLAETSAKNLVAAVLFDYRSLDTLGESTVLFTAVAGVIMLFYHRELPLSKEGLSPLAKRSMQLILPFIALIGFYIISHGHISPGGGFQGGTILASLIILLCIVHGTAFKSTLIREAPKIVMESTGATLFMVIGVVGLVAGGKFLSNLAAGFPPGTLGKLTSAGSIPFLNAAVGLKVAAGLALIFCSMVKNYDVGN